MNSAPDWTSIAEQFAKPSAKVDGESWFEIKAKADDSLDVTLYDEIGGWGINASDFKRALDGYEDVTEINVRIHSPGGSVFDGLAMYTQLKNHSATVNVHVDGLAASIASVIAMAGDVITIPENAFLMVHKPWVMASGDADALRENADLLDKVEKTLVAVYRDKTGLTDNEISDLLAAETWLSGNEAVELGFADQLSAALEMAASFKTGFNERFSKMPNDAKNLIGENATDPQNVAEPVAAVATPEPVAVAPTVNDFRAAEKARREEVKAVFADFSDYESVKNACLDDLEVTAEGARAALLAAMGANKTPSAAAINVGNGAIVRDSIENAVAARVGIENAESGNALAGFSLLELARASLVESGSSVSGLGKMDLVAAAFTHSSGDFGSALADVAHKSMLKGYEEVPETYSSWTSKGNLSDFRVASRVDMSRFPSLRKVAEGAEFKYVTTSDRAEQIMLATYGELFSITRQAIINDDLSVFDRLPRMMGRAAQRTIGDMVYAILTQNAVMADGKGLFHADHNNISTGAFGVSALDAAKVAMATQKEGGASLGIKPATLITSVARESAAKAYLGAEFDPAFTDANVPNPVRGMVDVIAESRLDDADPTVSYMVASPSQYDTVEVAYLDGNESPFLEQQGGFSVDGTTFKVRIDAGVAPMSFRTIQKLIDA